jgi:hypothetical protein
MTADLLIEEEASFGKSGGPFNPLDLPGLKGWWDLSDTSLLFSDFGITNITTDGELIAQANDKSGLGNNLTSPPVNRPIWRETNANLNNLGSAYFSGGTKYLLIPNIPHVLPLYIFAVMDKTPQLGGERFLLTSVGTGQPTNREISFWGSRQSVTQAEAISYADDRTAGLSRVITNTNVSPSIITFEILADGTPSIRRAPSYSVTGPPVIPPLTSMLALGGTTGSGNLVRGYTGELLICTGSVIPPEDLSSLTQCLNDKWDIY